MIATSSAPVAHTPVWREGDPDAPVFLLRGGTVIERAQFEAELAGPNRAGRVWGYELREAIREGLMALMEGDPQLDEILALIEIEDEEEVSDEDKSLLSRTRSALAEHWEPYRQLIAQMERRREVAPILALRRFCVGIEAAGVTFERDKQGMVAEATLASLNPLEMISAGNAAYGLLYTPPGAEGNLPRRSQSDATPTTSSSDAQSKVAGKSKASGGRKTRASRSKARAT